MRLPWCAIGLDLTQLRDKWEFKAGVGNGSVVFDCNKLRFARFSKELAIGRNHALLNISADIQALAIAVSAHIAFIQVSESN